MRKDKNPDPKNSVRVKLKNDDSGGLFGGRSPVGMGGGLGCDVMTLKLGGLANSHNSKFIRLRIGP